MFEGCKLQTWPEQLLFHEVEKVTNISPFSVALPLYPRCVPSSLVVERGMVPGIMGRKEDFYNHLRSSFSRPISRCLLPLAINKILLESATLIARRHRKSIALN